MSASKKMRHKRGDFVSPDKKLRHSASAILDRLAIYVHHEPARCSPTVGRTPRGPPFLPKFLAFGDNPTLAFLPLVTVEWRFFRDCFTHRKFAAFSSWHTVKITEYLLSKQNTLPDWSLLRAGSTQLLPCRIPFGECKLDLTPAVQGYLMDSLKDASRFAELWRLSLSSEDPNNWSLRLIECMLLLERNEPDNAWQHLQSALAWRNKRETEPVLLDAIERISVSQWLVMATISLAVGKTETAESYASEAIARIEKEATCCVGDLLRDTRADAMTTFAAIRIQQHRFQEAEMLLQLAHDAHTQAGDLEQMVVNLVYLSDVELYSGNAEAATYLLLESETILNEECDPTRHVRQNKLKAVIHQRLVDGFGNGASFLTPAGAQLN